MRNHKRTYFAKCQSDSSEDSGLDQGLYRRIFEVNLLLILGYFCFVKDVVKISIDGFETLQEGFETLKRVNNPLVSVES